MLPVRRWRPRRPPRDRGRSPRTARRRAIPRCRSAHPGRAYLYLLVAARRPYMPERWVVGADAATVWCRERGSEAAARVAADRVRDGTADDLRARVAASQPDLLGRCAGRSAGNGHGWGNAHRAVRSENCFGWPG